MTADTVETTLANLQANASPSQSAWLTASRVTLLATLMVAPLAFGSVQPWAWAALCILSGVALTLWSAGCASLGRVRIIWTAAHVIALLALVLVAGQLLSGRTSDFVGTREALIKLVGYCTIAFLAGQLSIDLSPRSWRRLGFAIVVYVFVIAVFAIVQFFSNPELIYWIVKPRWGGRIFGPYVNHNHYAGLFEMLLPLAVGSLMSLPERHAFKLFGLFAVVLGVASVILCGSRGGTIAVFVELVMFFGILVSSRAPAARRVSLPIALIAAALAAVLVMWLDSGTVLKRWENTARAPEVAAETRLTMVADSMKMLRKNPVSGVGAGAFEIAYPSYQSWVSEGVVDHAHNDYAELLAETGISGGLLLLLSIYLFLRLATAALAERLAQGWMGAAAAIACCGLLVHSFSDFNLHIPANAAWFSAAMGIVAVSSGTAPNAERKLRHSCGW